MNNPIVLTDEDIKKYMSSRGVRCLYPDCDSDDLDVGSPEFESENEIQQYVRCNGCGRAWYDIYTLAGVEEERE